MHYVILLIFCMLGNTGLLSYKVDALLPEEIVGGYEAEPGSLTFMVTVKAKNEHVCGGSVLSNTLVITAVQCLLNERLGRFHYKSYKVLITSNFLSQNDTVTSVPVEKAYVPLSFNITTYFHKTVFQLEEEFAILKLKRGLGVNFIRMLRVFELQERSVRDRLSFYTVSGYGVHSLSNDGTYLPTDAKLRYAEVELIPIEVCSIIYNQTFQNFLLCGRVVPAPGIPRGTCRGDIGSPLVQNYVTLVGVLVYYPESCNDSLQPSIYLRISYYSALINNAFSENTSNMRVYTLRKIASKFRFEEDIPYD